MSQNYLDKVRRLRLVEGDAAAMHSYFMRMKANNFDFLYAMDLNEKGRLRNVFWADARSRAACKEFGDVVTFDTTYLVNRYDMPFAPFVGVNHHGQSILLGCGLISHEDRVIFMVISDLVDMYVGLCSQRNYYRSMYGHEACYRKCIPEHPTSVVHMAYYEKGTRKVE